METNSNSNCCQENILYLKSAAGMLSDPNEWLTKKSILLLKKNAYEQNNKEQNIKLIPVAKDLISSKSPKSNEIFIDPKNGRFVLPRPAYWSRCENMNNLTAGDIGKARVKYVGAPIIKYKAIKFQNGIGVSTPLISEYPLSYGIQIIPDNLNPDKGTASLWLHGIAKFKNYFIYSFTYFFNYDNYIRIYNDFKYNHKIKIKLNGIENEADFSIFQKVIHIYITYDKEYGIKVYGDGKLIINRDESFLSSNILMSFMSFSRQGIDVSEIFFENIKIWNEIVSFDPNWEYNNGQGREYALHPIYGAANGYKLSNDFKIGYYCKE